MPPSPSSTTRPSPGPARTARTPVPSASVKVALRSNGSCVTWPTVTAAAADTLSSSLSSSTTFVSPRSTVAKSWCSPGCSIAGSVTSTAPVTGSALVRSSTEKLADPISASASGSKSPSAERCTATGTSTAWSAFTPTGTVFVLETATVTCPVESGSPSPAIARSPRAVPRLVPVIIDWRFGREPTNSS